MTIPQIQGFMEAIQRRQALHHASLVSNVAIAASGDPKGIKKAIDTYASERKKIGSNKPKTKAQLAQEEAEILANL